MKTEIAKNTNTIIQIELYSHAVLTNQLVIQTLILGAIVALLTCLLFHFLLGIDTLLMYIMIATISIVLTISIRLFNYLFPSSESTLILAFNELQLMKNKQILWCENIDEIHITKFEHRTENIPILQIKGKKCLSIIIGYDKTGKNEQTAPTNQPIEYLIYSKSDWELLKKYLSS